VNLRPLGDRILIKPEIPTNVTESGLILQEDRKPEQTGTVIAVGPCPHPRKQEVEEWAEAAESHEVGTFADDEWLDDLAALLRDLVRKEPEVKVGDYVVFSWTSGQEIWLEDGEQRYLLMRESDILCVVEGLEA
jgi:chaperonin GroES